MVLEWSGRDPGRLLALDLYKQIGRHTCVCVRVHVLGHHIVHIIPQLCPQREPRRMPTHVAMRAPSTQTLACQYGNLHCKETGLLGKKADLRAGFWKVDREPETSPCAGK